jgi:hypothetical protein
MSRGLSFWVDLVVDISVDKPSRKEACERVVNAIERECTDGAGTQAEATMADGSKCPPPPLPLPVLVHSETALSCNDGLYRLWAADYIPN